jgi:hypothetical protein
MLVQVELQLEQQRQQIPAVVATSATIRAKNEQKPPPLLAEGGFVAALRRFDKLIEGTQEVFVHSDSGLRAADDNGVTGGKKVRALPRPAPVAEPLLGARPSSRLGMKPVSYRASGRLISVAYLPRRDPKILKQRLFQTDS